MSGDERPSQRSVDIAIEALDKGRRAQGTTSSPRGLSPSPRSSVKNALYGLGNFLGRGKTRRERP